MREVEIEIRVSERGGKFPGIQGMFRKRITDDSTLSPGVYVHEEFFLGSTPEEALEWADEICRGNDYGVLNGTLPRASLVA